jgi:hypothetical protein
MNVQKMTIQDMLNLSKENGLNMTLWGGYDNEGQYSERYDFFRTDSMEKIHSVSSGKEAGLYIRSVAVQAIAQAIRNNPEEQ